MIQKFQLTNPNLTFSLELHQKPELVSEMMKESGEWEPVESSIVANILRQGDSFIDVGANIGYYSMLASKRVGKTGSVISLEPDPDNFALLEKNITRNKCANVSAKNMAAGSERGEITLYKSADNFGDHCTYPGTHSAEEATVSVIPLYDIIKEYGVRPRLIKIDCQGYEKQIFDGLSQAFDTPETEPEAIILEFWPERLTQAGANAIDFATEIFDRNYNVWDIGRAYDKPTDIRLAPFKKQIKNKLVPGKEMFTNLLMFKSSLQNELDLWRESYGFRSKKDIFKLLAAST